MGIIRDLRYAARALASKPWLTSVIVLTLALGIGANTAIFSVVNAVLLRPLPYHDSERLVWVWSTDPKSPLKQWVSYPDLVDWRAQSQTLEHLASWFGYEMVLTGAGEPERVQAMVVRNGDLFTLLGVPPMHGSTFRTEHDQPQERAVVLSHGYWQRRFSADPKVVGRGITLSGESHTVVGVMPPGFQFPIQAIPVDMWVTLTNAAYTADPQFLGRDARLLEVIGRVRPDASVERAQAEMDVIASGLRTQYPDTNANIGVRLVPAADYVSGGVSRPLFVLFAAVGCVLLIACVNVANLLLARAAGRQREIAVRAALGASRARIRLQLLSESLLLASAGGLAGALVAVWGVEALVGLIPADLPRGSEIGVDGRVLGFTAVAALGTGLLFGLVPAWHASKVDLRATLQDAARTVSDGTSGRRLRGVLVVGELALAMILLTGAALFIHSFWRLNQRAPGFDPRNVLTFEVTWPWEKYSFAQAGDAFRELQTRLQAIPGVRGAAAGLQLPDRGGAILDGLSPFFEIEGRPVAPAERPRTGVVSIQPGFFRTLGVPLLKGRDFDERDRPDRPLAVIINESLARVYLPHDDPIGKRLALESLAIFGPETPMREIVGVVGDVKHRGQDADARPLVYFPLAQRPFNLSHMVVKTDGDPATFVSAVRAAVQSFDKDQPIYDVQTLEQRIGSSLAQERFSALLLTVFSTLALLLAAVGLYGVLSYLVTQRTHELGIRLALGAEAGAVLRLVLRQGMTLVLTGVVIGLAGTFALGRLVASLLFGVTATDPWTLALVTVLLTLVAVLACWIPARRAAKVDPVVALRCE